MSTKSLPSQEYLRQCFGYDPTTGVAIWLHRPKAHFCSDLHHMCWNRRFPGKVAGSITSQGYRTVDLEGMAYAFHRLIWKVMTGYDPKGMIDHVNGDKADNRWVNLRSATRNENMRNRKRNRSKHHDLPKGVYLACPGQPKPFHARIEVNGVVISLRYHATPEQAHAAYLEAAKRYFGEFARAG